MIERYRLGRQSLAGHPNRDWSTELHRLIAVIVGVPAFSCATALTMGALTVLGYAPFFLFPLPVLSLAILFGLVLRQPTAGRAALVAFCFGLGLFGAGVSWIYVSLHVYGGMPVVLAIIATIGFCSFLALFPALFGAAAWWGRDSGQLMGIVALPACWVATEWLRGVMFTGFPWLAVGYSQTFPSPLAGYVPVLGVYGVSLIVAASAALLHDILAHRKGRKRWGIALLFGMWAVGAGLQQVHWTSPVGPSFPVALLQGNISQDRKWRVEEVASTLDTYRSLLQQQDAAKLVVMPETALPLFADRLPSAYVGELAAWARATRADLIIGVPERVVEHNETRDYNSAITMGMSSVQTYRKQHLVPFGEFMPAKPLLGWVLDILHIPLADLSPGAAAQPPLRLAGQRVAVNICFEDVFGEEIIRTLPEATVLVNLSNLAWFGDTLALPQHLQIAQVRAMETGRYMLRATNTGATGIINERGRIVQLAPMHRTVALSGMAQGFTGATPYVRMGNLLTLVFCGAGVLFSLCAAARRCRARSLLG